LPEGSWQLGQFFIDEDSAEKRALRDVVNCKLPRPAYAKIKTAENSSKANTAFSRNFPPAKISRYMIARNVEHPTSETSAAMFHCLIQPPHFVCNNGLVEKVDTCFNNL